MVELKDHQQAAISSCLRWMAQVLVLAGVNSIDSLGGKKERERERMIQ